MVMQKDVLKARVAEFADLDAVRLAGVPDGRFSVGIDAAIVDCLFIRQPGEKLFVILHGSRNPDVTSIPIFSRWSWHEMFPGSVLYVSDFTLDVDPENMHLSWYLGSRERDGNETLQSLVRVVADFVNSPTRQIVVYGSSGGGFAALRLASALGDATAIVINPQVNALDYIPRFVSHATEKIFGIHNPTDLPPDVALRMNALPGFLAAGNARCIYAQNRRDAFHYNNHYLPFCESLGVSPKGDVGRGGQVVTLLYDDPKGHGGEPRELAPKLIAVGCALADSTPEAVLRQDLAAEFSAWDRLVVEAGVPLSLRGLVADAMQSAPDELARLPIPRAVELLKAVFADIREELAEPEAENVRIPALGRFRIRRVTAAQGLPVRAIDFIPEKGKPRSGGHAD